MQRIFDDVRFGVRLLSRSPGFAAAALITLGLGIGANTTLFSLADALYLRPLPVPDASRVVHVYQTRKRDGAFPLSLADYQHYRDHAQAFEGLAAHYPTSPFHVVIEGEPLAVTGSVVTESYFRVLRLTPHVGRFFRPEEDSVPDRDAVAVIGYGLWQRRFGGDPSAVGHTLRVNGRAFTIVGVAPRGFDGVLRGGGVSQVWIPSAMFRLGYRYCDAFARDCTIVDLLGRLKPAPTIADAQAELDVLARQLETSYPSTNEGLGVVVLPARGAFQGQENTHRTIVALLLGGVSLLLFVACANVAGLLVARGITRRKEIAIRLALGAGRGGVIRQLLVESAVLAVGGGALGLLLATWAKELVASFYATDYAGRPVHFGLEISGWVLAATAMLCGITAILCGLAPALHVTRSDVLAVLKVEAVSGGRPRSHLRDALVVAQVALSMVLLVGAGLLVRSVLDIERGPGVDPRRIILLRLRPSLVGYESGRARAFQREVVRRLEALPGVEAASASVNLPLFGFSSGLVTLTPLDASGAPVRAMRRLRANHVGDRFFEVLGLPLVAGRDFNSADRPETPPVAIIDDLLADSLGGRERVVGQVVAIDGRAHEIVGVAPAAHYHSALESLQPGLYLNYWQQDGTGFSADSRTHVRVAGDARAMMPRIRREIVAIDPGVPISEDYPLSDRVRFNFQPVRVVMTLLVGFGALALVLSAVGLYGVVAFVTSMRTREIAIRVAVGANSRDIRALVVGHGARLAALGAAFGLLSAFGASRLLRSLLYGVSQHDFGTFVVVPAILLVVALLASWLPARRAMRIEPALTLRQE